MVISRKKLNRIAGLWADPDFQREVLKEIESQRLDPLTHSALPYWLGLDLWTKEEGLLILAGVEPGSVELAWTIAETGSEPWRCAQPFAEHISFSALPYDPLFAEAEFREQGAYEEYLERLERQEQVLKQYFNTHLDLLHRLDHSYQALGPEVENGKWRPIAFLAWAKSIPFTPTWAPWATARGLIGDSLDPTITPYFDADAPDYPELLVVAIRAWEVARQSGQDGTPKQRIDRFLRERYPHLAASTREAIALVTNWQKAGGRPSKN